MSRGGKDKYRDDPERRCLVTGEVQPKRGLIRFAVSPDGQVVPDILAKLPGRGLWVSAEREALEKAVAKGLFARGAKAQVTVPDDLVDQVEVLLARRVIDGISMARKAGLAIAGYEKVKDALGKESVRILFQASDGSERGKSKLFPPGGRGSFFEVLTASELGLSFGRERVIHAALGKGGLTERIREDAIRLSGVRESIGGDAAGKVKKTL
ncbi:RNA-binding protein [Alphaproteobacteria bacterium GH1-50]|uniref:RNA-binding protein n=1 Tax=Kangsaoukella pontilimi TaxID=2691042 RepID=A0A7C9MDI6_9RHOB|nr:RNA-binding protein [Kangsaoukella pontilimi]MXQ08291.1 RNA-binding protein [Kangsaoukella pontilimi]